MAAKPQARKAVALALLALALVAFRYASCGPREAFVKPPKVGGLEQMSLSAVAAGASSAWFTAVQEAAARRQYVDRFMEDEEPVDPTTTADGTGFSLEQVFATLGMLPNLLVLVLFAGGVREFIARGGGFARNEDT